MLEGELEAVKSKLSSKIDELSRVQSDAGKLKEDTAALRNEVALAQVGPHSPLNSPLVSSSLHPSLLFFSPPPSTQLLVAPNLLAPRLLVSFLPPSLHSPRVACPLFCHLLTQAQSANAAGETSRLQRALAEVCRLSSPSLRPSSPPLIAPLLSSLSPCPSSLLPFSPLRFRLLFVGVQAKEANDKVNKRCGELEAEWDTEVCVCDVCVYLFGIDVGLSPSVWLLLRLKLISTCHFYLSIMMFCF